MQIVYLSLNIQTVLTAGLFISLFVSTTIISKPINIGLTNQQLIRLQEYGKETLSHHRLNLL